MRTTEPNAIAMLGNKQEAIFSAWERSLYRGKMKKYGTNVKKNMTPAPAAAEFAENRI